MANVVVDSAESLMTHSQPINNANLIDIAQTNSDAHLQGIANFYLGNYSSAAANFESLDNSYTLDAMLLAQTGLVAGDPELTNQYLLQLSDRHIPQSSFGERYVAEHVSAEKAHLLISQASQCQAWVCAVEHLNELEKIAPNHWVGKLLQYQHGQLTFEDVAAQSVWYGHPHLLQYVESALQNAIQSGDIDYVFLSTLVDSLTWQHGPDSATLILERLQQAFPETPELAALQAHIALRAREPELARLWHRTVSELSAESNQLSALCCFIDQQVECGRVSAEYATYLNCLQQIYQPAPTIEPNELAHQQTELAAAELQLSDTFIVNGDFSEPVDNASWFFSNYSGGEVDSELVGTTFVHGTEGWPSFDQNHLKLSRFGAQIDQRAGYFYFSHNDAVARPLVLAAQSCYLFAFSYKVSAQSSGLIGAVRIGDVDSAVAPLVNEGLEWGADSAEWKNFGNLFCNDAVNGVKVNIAISTFTSGEMWLDNVGLYRVEEPAYATLLKSLAP